MFSSVFFLLLLRERSRTFSKLPWNLSAVRSMGGGPRTFPGGLNKWQYKRMHEKMAKEKERKLLEQEKQLYQARLRSEIRAKLAGRSPPPPDTSASSPAYGPMTAKDHVKALADRFMKEGAEDLWNEDDGPFRSTTHPRPPPPRSDPAPPLDLRRIVSERRSWAGSGIEPFNQRRQYSVEAGRRSNVRFRSKWDSDSDSDSDSGFGLEDDLVKPTRGRQSDFYDGKNGGSLRYPAVRFGKGDSDVGKMNLKVGGSARKKMMSSAALGNYDPKKVRRVPKPMEVEASSSEQIQHIRDDLRKRNLGMAEVKSREMEEESLFTQKGFDECNISPLTIQALTSAGYVNMTVVQEAALPICLDGKDVLVKSKTGTGKSAAFLFSSLKMAV